MKRHLPHLLVLGLVLVVLATGIHQGLRNLVTDSRFALLEREPSGEVFVVAIDSRSLDKIGTWPWSRRLHADIITKLQEAGAGAIAFDIDFSSRSDGVADGMFAEALQRADGSVILPTFKQWTSNRDGERRLHYNRPLPEFTQHSWPALVNVFPDPDGRVRAYRYGERQAAGFVASLATVLAGQQSLSGTDFRIDYSIRLSEIPVVSYVDVVNADPSTLKKTFEYKKVIVGGTALELGDRVNIPNGRIISGAVLQALAAESLLQGRALRGSGVLLALAAALAIGLAAIGTWGRVSYLRQAGLLVLLGVMAEAAATLAQAEWPFAFDTSLLHVTIIGYVAAGAAYEIDLRGWLGRIAERRFQRVAMSVGDGLACVNREGFVTFWNPAAESMFGYGAVEMRGKPLQDVLAKSAHPHGAFQFNPDMLLTGGEVVELEGRRKDGQTFPIEARLFGWEGAKGIEYGALLRDVSVRKRETERIKYLAQVDTLTGLANRHTLREHLDAMLMEAEAQQSELAVLVLDLDDFKDVNDSLGHTCGDELLFAVAARLRSLQPREGLVARLGGDEFAIVATGACARDDSARIAERICRSFKHELFSIHGRKLQVRCSIGIATYPRDTASPEQLLSNADLALYQAKAERGGKWRFFTEDIKETFHAKLSLEAELEKAIENGEFELFYQPQISLADGRLTGAEALIRWRHPQRGMLSPAEFMPVVHASAFSNEVAWWVLREACQRGADWQRAGRAIRVAVNLSPSQLLQSEDFLQTVSRLLERSGLSPALLELEVTEDTLVKDHDRVAAIFSQLRELGIQLSFDDFGTGYGSLTYLKKFPLDRLKIDRSFVQELQAGSDDFAIVKSTIDLAKAMGLKVLAEGIERAATVELLAGMGCDEGQGYHFGRPMPAEEFERRWVRSGNRPKSSRPVEATAA
jgi:diguanylate cyclase (GGDEF)-like protein/PAS domain S-box-containing protein